MAETQKRPPLHPLQEVGTTIYNALPQLGIGVAFVGAAIILFISAGLSVTARHLWQRSLDGDAVAIAIVAAIFIFCIWTIYRFARLTLR